MDGKMVYNDKSVFIGYFNDGFPEFLPNQDCETSVSSNKRKYDDYYENGLEIR